MVWDKRNRSNASVFGTKRQSSAVRTVLAGVAVLSLTVWPLGTRVYSQEAARQIAVPRVSFAPNRSAGEPLFANGPVRNALGLEANASLLDVGGQFSRKIFIGEMLGWKRELHTATVSLNRQARLHVWLGEYALTQDENPWQARWHFRKAQSLVSRGNAAYGLAAQDTALSFLRQSDFPRAADAYKRVLNARPALKGASLANCTLQLRQAQTLRGYHEQQQKQGIPQPPRLDPKCGVAALAVAFRALNLPYDEASIRAKCRVTGLGSTSQDLLKAVSRAGLDGHMFTATEKGLRQLPKPLVAYVQHDHFIAVTGADDKGVTYACSDCGSWPGGPVRLTWKQWRMMEAGPYLTVTRRGTPVNEALNRLAANASGAKNGKPNTALFVRADQSDAFTLARDTDAAPGLHIAAVQTPLGALAGQIATQMSQNVAAYLPTTHLPCGKGPSTGGAAPGAGPAFAGDPVNLATGEEEQHPDPDLSVYNPNGPSVVWSRSYRSMRDENSNNDNNTNDYGPRWSRSYNVLINDATIINVPQIKPGATHSINTMGVEYRNSGGQWEIVRVVGASTTTVATQASPNGWSVSPASSSATVTAPASVTDSTGYKVRWQGNLDWFARFDVLGPGLVLPGGASVTLPLTGTTPPDNPGTASWYWQIVQNGATVATKTDPQGWTVDADANLQPIVHAPMSAVVGTGYEVRIRAYTNPNYDAGYYISKSATFDVVPCRLEATTDPKYVVMPNYARLRFSPPAIPSASQPVVLCPITQGGNGMMVEWYYDPNNPLGYYAVLFPDGSRWVMTPTPMMNFGDSIGAWANFALRKVVDRMGHSITFNYVPGTGAARAHIPLLSTIVDDTSGTTLLTVTHITGSTVGNSYYNTNGRIQKITDCFGRSVVYDHSMTQTGSLNGQPIYNITFDSVSPVVTANTSTSFKLWQYEYSGEYGFLSSVVINSPTGQGTATTTIQTGTGYRAEQVTDPNGNYLQIQEVDANHTRVTAKSANGTTVHTYVTEFNADQNVTATTDGTGAVTSTTTYGDGNSPLLPSAIEDAEGHRILSTYDHFGNVKTTTDVRGNVTTYTYDYNAFPLGRLTQVQKQGRQPVTFTYYEPSGLVHTVTESSPSSGTRIKTYTYDAFGNVLTVTGPGNNAMTQSTVTFSYTQDGAYSQPAALGQPITVTDALGHTSHFRYDAQARVTSSWDALGNKTDITYNLVGQPVTVRYPATGQTGSGRSYTRFEYQYENQYAGGLLYRTSMYDESGTQVRQVMHTYDATGQELSVSGSTQAFQKTYDAASRLKTLTDGGGHTTTYTYNTKGYLSRADLPGGDSVQYTSYSASGRLLQSVDGNGAITNYGYDATSGALSTVQHPAYPAANVQMSYDGYGRLTGRADGAGSQSFAYGECNELTSTTTTYTGLPARTIGYTYYADGSRAGMTAGGATFAYTYDAAGRPQTLTGPGGTAAWTWANNNALLTQLNGNGVQTAYAHNALQQLTGLTHTLGSSPLSEFNGIVHDGAGNRQSVTATVASAPTYSGATNYAYDGLNQLTQEQSTRLGGYTSGFGHDGGGNLTNVGGLSRVYNTKNQLTGGTGLGTFTYDGNGNPTTYKGAVLTFGPNNEATAFGSALSAGYRGDGLRAWKENSSGSRTYYLYDGTTPIVELNGAGAVAVVNTFGANGLLSRTNVGIGGATVYYTFDERGNTVQRVDGTGNVLSSHVTDAYGVTTGAANGSSSDPFSGFGGQWGYQTDHETGFVLCTFRYYDPQLGRWLTRDPIGFAGGLNLYAYCTNNPSNLIDMLGLSSSAGGGTAGFPDRGMGPFDGPPTSKQGNSFDYDGGFLFDWVFGLGSDIRYYGPMATQTQDLRRSTAGDYVRQWAREQGVYNINFETTRDLSGNLKGDHVGTLTAAGWNISHPANWTQQQVGGFGFDVHKVKGENYYTVTITNVAGVDSFFYSAPSLWGFHPFWDGNWKRTSWGFGPMGSIVQKFRWNEPVK